MSACVLLMMSLAVPSVGAQTLRDSIDRAAVNAARLAAVQDEAAGSPSGKKFVIWGAVLLGVGAVYLINAATLDSEGSSCLAGTCVDNGSIRAGRFALGAGLAGVGGFLLAKGISRSHHKDTRVGIAPHGGVVLTQRFTF